MVRSRESVIYYTSHTIKKKISQRVKIAIVKLKQVKLINI